LGEFGIRRVVGHASRENKRRKNVTLKESVLRKRCTPERKERAYHTHYYINFAKGRDGRLWEKKGKKTSGKTKTSFTERGP